MRRIWEAIAGWWCYQMHRAPMWPVNGFWQCPDCQRRHRVAWANEVAAGQKHLQIVVFSAVARAKSDCAAGGDAAA